MSGELNIENHFPGEPDLPEDYLQHARLTIAELTGDVAATRELMEILGLMPHRLTTPPTSLPEIEPEEDVAPSIPIKHLGETTTVEVTLIRGEGFQIPCQADDCTRPAEWILWRTQCCDMKTEPILACTRCTTEQLASPPPVWCANCSHMFTSMTEVFPTIEPLGT